MAGIKAIETHYKGYRFRSRLEARWAVFFDALGWEYQYEPQGFEKQVEGDAPLRYLPDFLLVKHHTWVEVKGCAAAFQAEAPWMEEFLDYGCPLPGFDDSGGSRGQYEKLFPVPLTGATFGSTLRGLLILGDIPDPTLFGFHLHPLIQHHKGLRQSYAYFDTTGPKKFEDVDGLLTVLTGLNALDSEDVTWTTGSLFAPSERYWTKVLEAYRAARSARFEHGETPRV